MGREAEMAGNVQDLYGHAVYFRLSDRVDALVETTGFNSLVGDGKLIACPNNVVVGEGSKWVHETVVKHRYSVFDRDIVSTAYGRSKSARCVLMFPLDWWLENQKALRGLKTADIGFGISDAEGLMAVYAGRFIPTKTTLFPSLKRAGRGASGDLKLDRTKDVHFEFVCVGGEVFASKDGG